MSFYGKYSGIFGGGGGGAGGTGGVPFQEIPAGLVNSANVTYTLSQIPNPALSLLLFLDGQPLDQGVDYTLSGATITMAVAPLFAQELYAYFVVVAAGSGAVDDVNGVVGSVNILPGTGITVTNLGQNITIASTGASLVVDGTRAAPQLITAAGGLAFTGSQSFTKKYIAGNGGPIVVTANPQIAAGTVDGQQLTIQGTNATDTVQLSDGTGLALNGAWVGGLNSIITLSWDGSFWVEVSRQ